MGDYDTTYGHVPKGLSLKGMEENIQAKIQAEFDALPNEMKKALYDFMYEYTEEIIDSMQKRLNYTEPLKVIGLGDYKI